MAEALSKRNTARAAASFEPGTIFLQNNEWLRILDCTLKEVVIKILSMLHLLFYLKKLTSISIKIQITSLHLSLWCTHKWKFPGVIKRYVENIIWLSGFFFYV